MRDGVWGSLVGQEELAAGLAAAVADPARLTHAYLFTGPPGSGRSTAARAFAAALLCPDGGCGECRECRTALDGSHADVEVVNTEGLSIPVKQARELALTAAHHPSVGAWRIIVIEDADRLTEQAADALLKALEEPSPRTVWMLCAPSPQDVIVTIRSRSRHLSLRTPPVEAVAALLESQGVDAAMAAYAARAAQSHIGVARWLARDESARARRHTVTRIPFELEGLGSALRKAASLHEVATSEAAAEAEQRDVAEREELLRLNGADPTARAQPPAIRGQLNQLAKEQKARATRRVRDVIDRTLVDLASVYRDALLVSVGASGVDLVNPQDAGDLQRLAGTTSADALLLCLEQVDTARTRIGENVTPLLALEAMLVGLHQLQGDLARTSTGRGPR
ncbi:DNA polymerase III subunit delta' [Kytococcus schroeteri]|uniref:DNA polymerase III subunit delta n=1 Tax=Kytococcus schroeteri TaxID=138300 RepID=A0A2I1PC36_9MICO|nr:DNA polymerase III subunit delta' [Kytococcus schroeteri]PKZ42174.1 DNA polymerase III subunit delta' [Kytococcus schroeteri]